MLLAVILIILFSAAMLLDLLDKLPLENALGRFIGMTVLPHGVMLVGICVENGAADRLGVIIPICLFAFYFMIRLAVKPYRVKFDKSTVNIRIRAMYGGKILLKYTAVSLVCQTVYYIFSV